jgi:hypothetical protein
MCIFGQADAQENPTAQPQPAMPVSNSPSAVYYQYKPLTFAQQRARFEAEQRMYRMEWNLWIGHSPLRPNSNASYMAASYYQNYYNADRGVLINTGTRGWYW